MQIMFRYKHNEDGTNRTKGFGLEKRWDTVEGEKHLNERNEKYFKTYSI